MLRASRGGPEEFDGVAELWWRDGDALLAAIASDAGRSAAQELLEDERRCGTRQDKRPSETGRCVVAESRTNGD